MKIKLNYRLVATISLLALVSGTAMQGQGDPDLLPEDSRDANMIAQSHVLEHTDVHGHNHGWMEEEEPEHREKCIPDELRAQIKEQIRVNRSALIKSGKLNPSTQKMPPMFVWPLRQADGFDYQGYYAISNYVDHDGTAGLRDYLCGSRTYNGHDGTDIRIRPFQWNKMDDGDVDIVAAAAGTIILKQDGFQDQSCAWGGGIPWNAVFVEHADGTQTWYGHMKTGSTTPKDSGDFVAAGEYLGKVGSSGNSTSPHLHLEVYDPSDNLIDPFQGGCNSLNDDSWWRIISFSTTSKNAGAPPDPCQSLGCSSRKCPGGGMNSVGV